jgi:hypothetical protein
MLLIAQLSAVQTPAEIMGARPPSNFVTPQARSEIITRLKPAGPCGAAGRMEAAYAVPTALYRHGDRPAKFYSRWQDYPDARGCLLGGAP